MSRPSVTLLEKCWSWISSLFWTMLKIYTSLLSLHFVAEEWFLHHFIFLCFQFYHKDLLQQLFPVQYINTFYCCTTCSQRIKNCTTRIPPINVQGRLMSFIFSWSLWRHCQLCFMLVRSMPAYTSIFETYTLLTSYSSKILILYMWGFSFIHTHKRKFAPKSI